MKLLIADDEPLSKDDRTYIQILEDHPKFWNRILTTRKDFGIPNSGYPMQETISGRYDFVNNSDKESMFTKLEDKENNWKLIAHIALILDLFNLSLRWMNTLTIIIMNNVVIAPRDPVDLDLKRSSPFPSSEIDELLVPSKKLEITVYDKMSFQRLIDTLRAMESQGGKVSKMLEGLPGYPDKPDVTKIKNIIEKKMILKLKRENKSLSEIATQLEKEFSGSMSFTPTKTSVQTYLNRYTDDIISLSNPNSLLQKAYDEGTKQALEEYRNK